MSDVQLYLGNCKDILPKLIGIDAIVTDSPYGISHKRGQCADRGKGITLGSVGIVGDSEPFDPKHLLVYPNVLLWGANWFSDSLPGGR